MTKMLFTMFLALCLYGCAVKCSRADQLDFLHHHDTGLAIVTYCPSGPLTCQSFMGAYQQDTFDAIHDPELKVKLMSRLIIAPYFAQALQLPYFDGIVPVSMAPTASGHSLLVEGVYTIELVSSDVSVRDSIRSMVAEYHTTIAQDRLIVKTVRDALLFTITDKEN